MSLAIPTACLLALLSPAEPYDFEPLYLANARVEVAYRAIAHEQWRKADEALREYLDTEPQGELADAARFMLARVLAKRAGSRRVSATRRAALRLERIRLLERLAEDPGPLDGPIHLALAGHYAKVGVEERALAHYEKIPPGGVHYLRSRIDAAKLALEHGEAAQAATYLAAALAGGASRYDEDRIQLLQGRALAAMGKRTEAVRHLRLLWFDRFGRPVARRAARALKSLGQAPSASDVLVMEFSRVQKGTRSSLMRKLRQVRRRAKGASARAMSYARGVIAAAGQRTRRRAPRLLREAARARSTFVRGHALFRLALTLTRLDKDVEALAGYRKMARTLPNHPLAPQALVAASRLAAKAGDEALANELLQKLVERYPTHPKRADYGWQLAWETYRSGDFRRAAVHFDQLAKNEGRRLHLGQATWEERALYWRGRCEMRGGDRGRAIGTWEYIVRHYPLTYYSHQAFNRISELDPDRAAGLRPHRAITPYDHATLTDLSRLNIEASDQLDTAVALVRIGYFAEARKDLQTRARLARLGPDGMTLLVSLSLREQKYADSHSIVRWRGTLPRYPDEADARLWKLAYPLPFWSSVSEFSKEWGISPYLVLALIRHESRYNPRAVSRSRAVGLTQLLVGTARGVARKLLRSPAPTFRALKTPRTNIRIGSRFLKELMVHFVGNEALALAAYNAGPGRARRWWRQATRQGHLDTDELVEEIPFRETHAYVKSVLASYGVYRYLYGAREDTSNRTIPLEAQVPLQLGSYFGRDGEEAALPEPEPPEGAEVGEDAEVPGEAEGAEEPAPLDSPASPDG